VSWYWWLLLWLVVLMLAMGVMVLFGLSLFRKAKALAKELSAAADRLGAVSEGLQDLAEHASDPAVFTPASKLRQEQILNRGGTGQAVSKPQPKRPSAQSQNQRVR
jgi:hypothetical protein